MRDAFATLEKNISSAIEHMPAAFNAHELILELAQKNQQDYIRALSESVESGSATPFQAVHSEIGKSLLRHSLEQGSRIQQTEPNSSSLNIFGVNSPCSRWTRLE